MDDVQQLMLYEYAPDVMRPEWEQCFKTCKHFDSHPDYPPDYFPGNRKHKRCNYCDHEGTSGKQFEMKLVDNTWHMFCKFYEYGRSR